MNSDDDDPLVRAGFPHSEIPGSKLVCQLPEAYRRLPRPSSPVAAKASTMCAYSLDHITPNGPAIAPLNGTTPGAPELYALYECDTPDKPCSSLSRRLVLPSKLLKSGTDFTVGTYNRNPHREPE